MAEENFRVVCRLQMVDYFGVVRVRGDASPAEEEEVT